MACGSSVPPRPIGINTRFFDQTEKDTNSQLNTFDDRHQNTIIANYYMQDFAFPGYTSQWSFHYNRDQPSFKFDANNFLALSHPVGVFRPHQVEAYYFGNAGDGHIGRVNINHAFYWVVGNDSFNSPGGSARGYQRQDGLPLSCPMIATGSGLLVLISTPRAIQISKTGRHRFRYDSGQSHFCRRPVQLLAAAADWLV